MLTASHRKLASCLSHAGASSYLRTHERCRRAQGCIVEVEGVKKDRFWTFGVVDRGGISLMRLSTADGQAADAWVQALAGAGCELRTLAGPCRMRSPLRSADVRWVRAAARAPPSAAGRAGRRLPALRAVLPGPTDRTPHGRPSVPRAHQRAASAGSQDRPLPCTGRPPRRTPGALCRPSTDKLSLSKVSSLLLAPQREDARQRQALPAPRTTPDPDLGARWSNGVGRGARPAIGRRWRARPATHSDTNSSAARAGPCARLQCGG